MAYANNYVYMYGFGLLDDLHNFFPEMLYDETLFPDQRFGWFRYRASSLFPTIFTRQMNMYRIYNAPSRQEMFQTWVHSQTIGVTPSTTTQAPPSVQSPVPIRTTPTPNRPPVTPTRTATAASIPPNLPPRRTTYSRTTTHGNDIDILTALFTIPTTATNNNRYSNPVFGTNDLLSLLTNSLNLQDVPVVPTLEDIEAASRVIPHSEIPHDVNCTICQEHNHPNETSWRRLGCSHAFHTSCIIPWFARNVHCPVCRADIRDMHDDMSTTESPDHTSTTPQTDTT
jgi:hypothetical protein